MSRFLLLAALVLGLSISLHAQDGDTKALIVAVEQNDIPAVQRLLKAGADVQATIPSTSPFYLFFLSREMYLTGLKKAMHHEGVYIAAIHANATRANAKVLKLLLKKRANIDAGDSEGKTPLMYALRSPGGEEYALQLIRKGANYTTVDNAGNTAMHYAAFGGNLEGVRMTLTGGTDINTPNHQGITPIHAAAVRADIAMMQAMVDLGADIHATDSAGFTALHYAAGYAPVDKLRWIMEQAPELNRSSGEGHTPLDLAKEAGNEEAVAFLRAKGGTYNAYLHQDLMDALLRRDSEAVSKLLAAGANPNRKSKTYPLHLAVQGGDRSSTELLLKAGADPNTTDAKDRTPLDLATGGAMPDIAKLLMANGAKADDRHLLAALGQMSSRETPGAWEDFALAVVPFARSLDAPGGTLDIPALHYAAYLGHQPLAEALLRAGASAAQPDAHGWTPLHWAVMKRDLLPRHPEKTALAGLLIEKGCPVEATSTKAKQLPHTQPYLAKRVPANATATDILGYALPKDPDMVALLQSRGGKAKLGPQDFTDNGEHFYFAKDYTAAMAELNKALQVEPRNPTALYLRGECKRQLGLLEEAERDFTEAIKHAGPHPEISLARGRVRHDLGKHAAAIADLDIVVRSGTKKPEALYWRGKCHLKNGNRNAACDDLRNSAGAGYEGAETVMKLYCN